MLLYIVTVLIGSYIGYGAFNYIMDEIDNINNKIKTICQNIIEIKEQMSSHTKINMSIDKNLIDKEFGKIYKELDNYNNQYIDDVSTIILF
jgi:hypothetical protein